MSAHYKKNHRRLYDEVMKGHTTLAEGRANIAKAIAVDTAGKTPPAGASKAAKPSTTPSIMRFMAPKLLASTHAAADRRFVIWSAVNMRAQNMRHDEGYKLHVGALCPEYVETTMSTETFNSILSTVYTETCDEVKKGLRLQRESCVKVGYLGPFLGAQLDLTTVANEEYITFSVSYIAEGETEITRVGLATRAFPGSHTAADIEPWIEKLTTEFFGELMGEDVEPKDVFLAFTVDQGGNVVNACKSLDVDVLKCNAHRLNSVTMWALGVNGSVNTCENPAMEKLMKRLAALVGVFSHSAVNNDELKAIQKLQEEFHKIYELIRRNDTRWTTQHAMMVRLLQLKKAIQEYFRTHHGNARKLTTREWTIANEVCSLLDVVAEVTIKIQGGVDTHISQTMFSMLEIKEIIGDTEHWIRAPDQAYDGGDVLKELTSLDDLTSEALKVRDTLLSRLESKGLGEASMPLERICALLDPRRKDCSEEHLLNGSAALKADAIADVKNVAKTFVDPVVVPASPAEDGSGSSGGNGGSGGGGSSGGGSGGGGSGGSGSGSGEPSQPPPKRQRPSALEERRRHRLASSKASSSSRASWEGKSTVTRRSVIERELRMYVAEDPTPEEDDFSLLDFWLRRSKATTCAETGEVEAGLPYLALIARLYHAIDSTSCQAERNFSALALLIGTMRSSMLPHKVERMMFLRLNRLVIPEVKALHNAVEANKAAAAQCKNKVVEVEAAAAGAPVTLTL